MQGRVASHYVPPRTPSLPIFQVSRRLRLGRERSKLEIATPAVELYRFLDGHLHFRSRKRRLPIYVFHLGSEWGNTLSRQRGWDWPVSYRLNAMVRWRGVSPRPRGKGSVVTARRKARPSEPIVYRIASGLVTWSAVMLRLAEIDVPRGTIKSCSGRQRKSDLI